MLDGQVYLVTGLQGQILQDAQYFDHFALVHGAFEQGVSIFELLFLGCCSVESEGSDDFAGQSLRIVAVDDALLLIEELERSEHLQLHSTLMVLPRSLLNESVLLLNPLLASLLLHHRRIRRRYILLFLLLLHLFSSSLIHILFLWHLALRLGLLCPWLAAVLLPAHLAVVSHHAAYLSDLLVLPGNLVLVLDEGDQISQDGDFFLDG